MGRESEDTCEKVLTVAQSQLVSKNPLLLAIQKIAGLERIGLFALFAMAAIMFDGEEVYVKIREEQSNADRRVIANAKEDLEILNQDACRRGNQLDDLSQQSIINGAIQQKAINTQGARWQLVSSVIGEIFEMTSPNLPLYFDFDIVVENESDRWLRKQPSGRSGQNISAIDQLNKVWCQPGNSDRQFVIVQKARQ